MVMLIDKRIIEKYAGEGQSPISVQSLVDRLQYHEFFRLFPIALRNDIINKATYNSFKCGEMVYSRGDKDAFMGVVMSGRIRMSMAASDGRGLLLGLVENGEVFGETALIDGLPRTTDAHADNETTIMIIKHDDFVNALKTNPEAMLGIIMMLCHRIRVYVDTIDMIALQNLPIRLSRLLLRLAGQYGEEENGHIVVRARLNQSALGQKLATSRESINRQLKSFAADGLISINGDDITLLDPEALHKITGE